MPLQYVGVNTPEIRSRLDMPIFQESLNRSQKRYDTAVANRELALEQALSQGYLNQEDRDIFEQKARKQFDDVSTKYSGDLSAGYDDVLGAVTNVRSDPYHQANKSLLEKAKRQEDLVARLGSNAYIQQDVLNERLYDPQGNLRDPNSFQSKVFDIQDFYREGERIGSELAQVDRGGYKSILNGQYYEKQRGFKDADEAGEYVYSQSGQDQITQTLEAKGANADDPRLRNIMGQAIINSSIGKTEKVANRNFESTADMNDFAFSQRKYSDLEEHRDEADLLNKAKHQLSIDKYNDLKTIREEAKEAAAVKAIKDKESNLTKVSFAKRYMNSPTENPEMNEFRELGMDYKDALDNQTNLKNKVKALTKVHDNYLKTVKDVSKVDPNAVIDMSSVPGFRAANTSTNQMGVISTQKPTMTLQQLSDMVRDIEDELRNDVANDLELRKMELDATATTEYGTEWTPNLQENLDFLGTGRGDVQLPIVRIPSAFTNELIYTDQKSTDKVSVNLATGELVIHKEGVTEPKIINLVNHQNQHGSKVKKSILTDYMEVMDGVLHGVITDGKPIGQYSIDFIQGDNVIGRKIKVDYSKVKTGERKKPEISLLSVTKDKEGNIVGTSNKKDISIEKLTDLFVYDYGIATSAEVKNPKKNIEKTTVLN